MKPRFVRPSILLACVVMLTPVWSSAEQGISFKSQTSTGRSAISTDEAWEQLIGGIQQLERSPKSQEKSHAQADRARAFYLEYKGHRRAVEARKLEALFLLDAVSVGDKSVEDRMQSVVAGFCGDNSIPASERAIVAGTYEFQMARERIHTQDDMFREYEAVARRLIREFPEQPQGYVSLLTLSMQRAPEVALAMAKEVAKSAGLEEVRVKGRRLVARYELIGKSIVDLVEGEKTQWQPGKPGVVYFWAASDPGSLALGNMLAGRNLQNANAIGICLDFDLPVARSTAATHKLPGVQIYGSQGDNSILAEKLGAFETPVIYLTDSNGVIKDVRGLENIENKLAALGL